MTKVIKKKNSKPLALSLLALLLVIAAGSYVLLRTKSETVSQGSTVEADKAQEEVNIKGENTVDYSPAKDEDNVSIPDKQIDTTAENPSNSSFSGTITSTRPSSDGNSYLVRVAVSGASEGKCSAILSQGQKEISATSSIGISAGQYSCGSLAFPMQELALGKWLLTVQLENNSGQKITLTENIDI